MGIWCSLIWNVSGSTSFWWWWRRRIICSYYRLIFIRYFFADFRTKIYLCSMYDFWRNWVFFNVGKFHEFTLKIMVQNLPEKRLGLIKIYLYRSKCLLSKSFITRGQRNVQRSFNEKSKQKTGMWDNWGSWYTRKSVLP